MLPSPRPTAWYRWLAPVAGVLHLDSLYEHPFARDAEVTKNKKKRATRSTSEPKRPKPLSRAERVARMKAARGLGEASFQVHLRKHTIEMTANDNTVISIETSDPELYGRLFDLMKSTLAESAE